MPLIQDILAQSIQAIKDIQGIDLIQAIDYTSN
jgi:hypothetical protein